MNSDNSSRPAAAGRSCSSSASRQGIAAVALFIVVNALVASSFFYRVDIYPTVNKGAGQPNTEVQQPVERNWTDQPTPARSNFTT